jgi:hypothetical protein
MRIAMGLLLAAMLLAGCSAVTPGTGPNSIVPSLADDC